MSVKANQAQKALGACVKAPPLTCADGFMRSFRSTASTRIRLRWQGRTRFTWVVELVEGPVDWSLELHAAGTRSRMQRCAWGSRCTREAGWSVRVKDKGGESWRAVC